MRDAQEIQSVLDEAERAASTGDYAAAERLLREAASQQELTLGCDHPDLANTFNNLGIVCELTDKPDDAEAFFRKSYAIATASLDPDHPFVATSRKNLEDFCAARGRPADVPASKPDVEPTPEPQRPVVAEPPTELDPAFVYPAPVAQPRTDPNRRLLGIGIGVFIGVFLLVLLIVWLRDRSTTPVASASGATESAPASTPAPPSAAPTSPGHPRPSAPPAAKARSTVAPPTPAPSARTSRSSGPQPDVVTAQLCSALSTTSSWHCAVVHDTVAPGPLYFYTRIKSPTATDVQHRWYRDDRLRQSVELPVSPNTKDGYRTYSKTTVSGAGQWRVELRGRDGVVLHQERFTVR